MRRLARVAAVLWVISLSAGANAEENPLATQAAEALQPVGKGINTTLLQFLAGSGGLLGKGAQHNLNTQAQAAAVANRGNRQTMQACIKPGNLIDDDVRECMNGTRSRDW